jgi:hypothetical protein
VDDQDAFVRRDNPEREVIILAVGGNRAYFATLFPGQANQLQNVPDLFDAMLSTLDLDPDQAEPHPGSSGT